MTVSADTLGEVCSYYDVLGVPRDADYLTIRRSFLAAALAHHPDRVANRSQLSVRDTSLLSSGLRQDGCPSSNSRNKRCSTHDLTEPLTVDDHRTIDSVSSIARGDRNCNNGDVNAIATGKEGKESGGEFLCTSTEEGDGCGHRLFSAAEVHEDILANTFVIEQEDDESGAAEVCGDHNDAASFLRIHDAWSVLRDPGKRKEYDEELNAAARRRESQWGVLVEDVDLDDMSWEQSEEVSSAGQYLYPCRCGDYYVVKDEDLMTCTEGASRKPSHLQSLITQCGSCSLSIRIQFCMVDKQE
eukprot:TRINITY_DN11615_c0_g1_i1.p1 TRINITY_DN11615_c0_g1~~TRINITY_DN11615_c0_g1_i1.p1  ORF type:complete len:300 (-),score=16.64 TRINITY_DN11615_c0_g1_i1:263-1162(-)